MGVAVPDNHALLWFDMFPLEAILGLVERYPIGRDSPSGNYFWQLGLQGAYVQGLSFSAGGHRPALHRSLYRIEGSPGHRSRSLIAGCR